MEIIMTKHYRTILFTGATILFVNAILGGQQFISDNVPPIAASMIELIVRLSECIIAYSFLRFFRHSQDNLIVRLSKLIFIGKVSLILLFLFHWTEILALLTIEGIISFLVLIVTAIWSLTLFLKEKNENTSFNAAKLFATFSLASVFSSFVISFNLLQSTDVYSNIVAGKTFIYWIPQFVLTLPYLVLFKFISTLRQDQESKTAST